jgi:MoaA/NifB/PqqE/SkfB family radical SAM enzyme
MALKRQAIHNYPVSAIIEPTSFCNLHCPACPTGMRLDLRPSISIKEDLFKAAIDEIGDYIFQLNMYNWGEPLLHKQTPEMIRYAKDKKISIMLSTNLSIKLTDDYIERLVRSGLDTMIVSLDGMTEETYTKYRRNGNLALVRENVMRIHQTKQRLGSQTPEVIWQFLVFRHNEHEIDAVREQYKLWGADTLSIIGAEMPLEEYRDGLEPSTMPQYNIYHPDNPHFRAAAESVNSTRSCTWLYGTFVMNPNGKVSPCCAVPAQQNDFSTYTASEGFFAAWNNSKFKRARQLFLSPVQPGDKNLTAPQKLSLRKRVDGMAAATELAKDELICQKCPIPDLQNYIDPVISKAAGEMLRGLWHDASPLKKAQYLMRYIFMGAPNWRDVGRLSARKVSTVLMPFANNN